MPADSPFVPDEDFIRQFTRSQRALYVYILSLLPNPSDAEEILQETNLVIWRKANEFTPGTSFPAWSRTVARFEVMRYRQTHARRRMIFNDDVLNLLAEDQDHVTEEINDHQEALDQCLTELRPKDRELIRMRYAPGMTGDEIAELLGRPVNSIYQSVGRIRLALAECVRLKLLGSTKLPAT